MMQEIIPKKPELVCFYFRKVSNTTSGYIHILNIAIIFTKFFKISFFIGTRHRGGNGQLLDFKKGAFHVALDAKMPILPVVISEYDDILGPPNEEQFHGGEATIQILPAIETEDVSKDDINELIKKTRDNMISALKSPTNQ